MKYISFRKPKLIELLSLVFISCVILEQSYLRKRILIRSNVFLWYLFMSIGLIFGGILQFIYLVYSSCGKDNRIQTKSVNLTNSGQIVNLLKFSRVKLPDKSLLLLTVIIIFSSALFSLLIDYFSILTDNQYSNKD